MREVVGVRARGGRRGFGDGSGVQASSSQKMVQRGLKPCEGQVVAGQDRGDAIGEYSQDNKEF